MIVAVDRGLSRAKIIIMRDNEFRTEERPAQEFDNILPQFKEASKIVAVENVPASQLSGFNNVIRVPELDATALGALMLTGLRKAIVASMGTGTAFMVASLGEKPLHIIGTGVGGGLIEGFSKYLGCENTMEFIRMAAKGDPWNVDLKVGHLYPEGLPSLPPETTASNMALLSKNSRREDIATGVMRLIGETIGVIVSLLARSYNLPLILVGGVSRVKYVVENIKMALNLFCKNANVVVPPQSHMATAFGALLLATEKDKWNILVSRFIHSVAQ